MLGALDARSETLDVLVSCRSMRRHASSVDVRPLQSYGRLRGISSTFGLCADELSKGLRVSKTLHAVTFTYTGEVPSLPKMRLFPQPP